MCNGDSRRNSYADASRRLQTAPDASRQLQTRSRQLQTAPDGSRGLQTAPDGSRRLQTSPDGSRRPKTALDGSRRLQTALQGRPQSSRLSQTARLQTAPDVSRRLHKSSGANRRYKRWWWGHSARIAVFMSCGGYLCEVLKQKTDRMKNKPARARVAPAPPQLRGPHRRPSLPTPQPPSWMIYGRSHAMSASTAAATGRSHA